MFPSFMRRFIRCLFSTCACLFAFIHPTFAAEPAPLRTALLAWEPVPARPDVRRVAADLVALAQAELSAEPGLAWVERTELDKLLAEVDLAASGHLDPRSSLRIGKLARAQLLVTGRLDASDFAKTTLTLEVLDLDRGDLLASSTTPVPARPHKHYVLRDEDRTTATNALRELLATAAARHHELAAKPAIALLFLANSGPSSRLDAAGERLASSLRDSAAAAGARVLRFPRASEAGAEQDLAILGLAEADDQAWRSVADLYVWGNYKEIPADGLPYKQTPVEASLTLWDGASAPRTIPWRGTVATFSEATVTFSAALTLALRKTATSDPDARATAAELLADQAAALERTHSASFQSADFWRSELGQNIQTHRVGLRQAACFLDPASHPLRQSLFNARWQRPHQLRANRVPEQLWRRYADLVALDALAQTSALMPPLPPGAPSSRRPASFDAGFSAATRLPLLKDIIHALDNSLRGEGRIAQPQLLHAARLWAKEANAYAATLPNTGMFSIENDGTLANLLVDVAGAGEGIEPKIDASEVGAAVLHLMIDEAWPALAPAFRDLHRKDPGAAALVAERIIATFRLVGCEDLAYSRLVAALNAAATPPATLDEQQADPKLAMDSLRELAKLTAESHRPPLKVIGSQMRRSSGILSISLTLQAPAGTPEPELLKIASALTARLTDADPRFRGAQLTVTASPSAPVGNPSPFPAGGPPDPPPHSPDWSIPAEPPPPATDLDRPLNLLAKPLHAFLLASRSPDELFARAYSLWPLNNRLPAPDAVRLLGRDIDQLWIDGLPLEGAREPERAGLRIATRSVYARAFHRLGDLLGSGSRALGVVFDRDTAYLATEFDGLWKLGPAPGEITRITPAQGLPSLRLSAITPCPGGLVVAAAPPERSFARLDFASGLWTSLLPPSASLLQDQPTRPASPRPPMPSPGGPPRFSQPASPSSKTEPAPLLCGASRWLLLAQPTPALLDTRTGAWSSALQRFQTERLAIQERGSAQERQRLQDELKNGDPSAPLAIKPKKLPPDWSLSAPSAVTADGDTFWLGGAYGLVHLDPENPAQARIEKCPPVLALADAGPWLWVAFSPSPDAAPPKRFGQPAYQNPSSAPHAAPYPLDERPEWRRSRLALYDKSTRRWLGSLEVEGGITTLATAPGRLWAAGSDLFEFDTTRLAAPAPTSGFAEAATVTATWAGLPSTTLHRAAALRIHATLDRLLAARPAASADTLADTAWSPLHAAAAAGDAHATDRLLAAGFPIDALTAEGLSPLALAAASGEMPALQRLLAAGADPSRQNIPRLAARSRFGENSASLPAQTPPQPTRSRLDVLPDGRIRLRWEIAPGSYEGFVIYRNEAGAPRPPGPVRFGSGVATDAPRNPDGLDDGPRYDYIGTIIDTVGPAEREWIDDTDRPTGGPCTYTVIAVNPHDRHGPVSPSPAGTTPAPAASLVGPATLLNVSPARLDPSPLHLAAAADQPEAVAALLAAGANPAAIDLGEHTPLLLAARLGNRAAARALVYENAPLNAFVINYGGRRRDGINAYQSVFRAPYRIYPDIAYNGSALAWVYDAHLDRELFERLLAAGADPLLGPDGPLAVRAAYLGRRDDFERFLALAPHPFVTDRYDHTAYSAALRGNRLLLAREIRERCFDPADPRWPAHKSERMAEVALGAALEVGDDEHIAWLLARPGLPRNLDWDKLLAKAVAKRAAASARLLVSAGADPQKLGTDARTHYDKLVATAPKPEPVPPAPGPAFTPAATRPPVVMLPFPGLLGGGRGYLFSPPPDSRWMAPPRSPALAALDARLRAASAAGDLSAISAALAEGALIDAVDEKGWTPLIHALQGAHTEAARLLVDHGASLNWLTRMGSTPLGFACDLPDPALAREFLDLGADPNLVNPHSGNGSPLTTIMTRRPATARLLLERGADPRVIVHSHGRGGALPPVFLAATRGDLASVKLLTEFGARPADLLWRSGASDHIRGQNALHSAAASNDVATLDYFLALGLDPKQTDAYGDNALDWALSANADRTAAKLRTLGVKTRTERGLPRAKIDPPIRPTHFSHTHSSRANPCARSYLPPSPLPYAR